MTAITEENVLLIQAWNRRPINLLSELVEKLEAIGATPTDIYGNGAGRHQIPCGVLTTAGERVDLALVTAQRDAPFESGHYRLGSDIADIYESPHALPLDVRLATSRAQEARMDFAPTLIEMPDGKTFVLNWQPNFLIKNGYQAADARLSSTRLKSGEGIDLIQQPDSIVHFVIDP